ncbi:MAG: PAS domain-containing protein [Caulobacteraceae bacterium]|nr:PAS domain-containing protein [Caulobacteraceae bacterium]
MTESFEPSPGLRGDAPAAATSHGLSDRKELAFISVERTRMPMVVTDPRQADNPIVLANAAFLDLSGYRADEIIGRNCRLLQGEDTCKTAIAEISEGVAKEREVNVEILNYRKDGSSFWNQLHLSPIHDDEGRLIYYFGSQLDVTHRRRMEALEAAERRLLEEVDHRAMNALATVDSIVRLTKAHTVALYAAAVQRRVHSLAKAHHILSRWRWRDIPLASLIQGQIEPFAKGRVDMRGPEVFLEAPIVQPLSLVVHELIANAVTHGALTQPTGSLRVHWSRDVERRRLELDWHETGGPAPAIDPPSGLGATMIKKLVDRQLQGRLSRTWAPDGLKAHLSLPMAA